MRAVDLLLGGRLKPNLAKEKELAASSPPFRLNTTST